MSHYFKVNGTWVQDAFKSTDPSKLMHPPPSATGFDMTWVIDERVKYACLCSVLIACVVSFLEIKTHAKHFDFPKIQIYVIRILFMIPFYGVLSVMSVFFHEFRFFLDTIRDTYESFVLYTFFSLLVEYCGGERQLLRSINAKRYMGVHPAPLCCLPMYPLNTQFFLRCKRYVLQYTLIKPAASFLTCVGAPLGWYEEASFTYDNLYPYLFTVNNISISYSLYYLVLFHLETEKELNYCKPAWKFICIKSIIFFAFWQSATVAVCIALGWMYTGDDHKTREEVNTAIQDVLMCFEILPVAFMHHYAFGRSKLGDEMAAEPIYDNDATLGTGGARKHIDRALDLGDVVQDVFSTIFYRGSNSLIGNRNENDDDRGAGGEDPDDPNSIGVDYGGGVDSGIASKGGMVRPAQAADPTVEELVAYAASTDRGVRADGLVHFDPDEHRDIVNQTIDDDRTEEFECFSKRALADGRADDADAARVEVVGGETQGPAAYCIVCGRFDRQLVKRKSGFKCVECIGTSSNKTLREKQLEVHAEDNDGSCVVCGRSGRPMVRRGAKMKCIDCL